MKALTIHTPWAPLIAVGEKEYETRGWKTNYRGPLAIHCSRTMDYLFLYNAWPFLDALRKHGLDIEDVNKLRGQVIATAELVDCIIVPNMPLTITKQEIAFGDFRPGRFAWKLANVKKLETPIPAVGKQGLWEWDGEIDESNQCNEFSGGTR